MIVVFKSHIAWWLSDMLFYIVVALRDIGTCSGRNQSDCFRKKVVKMADTDTIVHSICLLEGLITDYWNWYAVHIETQAGAGASRARLTSHV